MSEDWDECARKWHDLVVQDHLEHNGEPIVACGICGDKATGRHYGAVSCDGCKGFFRRSVRKASKYVCRMVRQCSVDRDKRNQCRYCRLRKCFSVGMRSAAVQNERDPIKVPRKRVDTGSTSGLTVGDLKTSELVCWRVSSGFASRRAVGGDERLVKLPCLDSLHNLMMAIIPAMTAWVKSVAALAGLAPVDQLTLVRAHATTHLLLNAVRLSLKNDGVIRYGDGLVWSNSIADGLKRRKLTAEEEAVSQISAALVNEVVCPLIELNATVGDIACLRALTFLNPHVEHLVERETVKSLRSEVQLNFQDFLLDDQYEYRGRHGELLLILVSLQCVSNRLFDKMAEAGYYNVLHLESSIRQCLREQGPVQLSDDDDDDDEGTDSSRPLNNYES